MRTNISADFGLLSDQALVARVRLAAADERGATARLIGLVMELDSRRLYLGEGCSSLFTYCTQVLHLSEHAAYNRIETARAARRFPVILELVASAAITLTTVRLLAPHLTDANHHDVLDRARHKTKREVELLVATLNPPPDVPSMVRKLPAPATVNVAPAAPQETATPLTSIPIEPLSSVPPAPRPVEVKPSRRKGTGFNSRSVARCTTSFGECRICCVTRCRTAIPPSSSNERSRHCSKVWSAHESARPHTRASVAA